MDYEPGGDVQQSASSVSRYETTSLRKDKSSPSRYPGLIVLHVLHRLWDSRFTRVIIHPTVRSRNGSVKCFIPNSGSGASGYLCIFGVGWRLVEGRSSDSIYHYCDDFVPEVMYFTSALRHVLASSDESGIASLLHQRCLDLCICIPTI